jgi:hypothetical protein
MNCYGGPHTALTIGLHGVLQIQIIMVRFLGLHTPLTIGLRVGLYLAIIMDRRTAPRIAITILYPCID